MTVQHSMFQSRTFVEGQHSVVGDCNGFTMQQRWDAETPVFATAIARHVDSGCRTVLDYGCGVGRIAKVLLERCPRIEILGVDASEHQLAHARRHVPDPRLRLMLPHHLDRRVDLAYSVYVLQHVPAIELRETIQRIHFSVKEGGLFVHCSSDARMAIRFDQGGFADDRFLGVDLRGEIERYFEPIGELFNAEELDAAPLVKTMITGAPSVAGQALAHPAIVYRRRTLAGAWGIPYLARRPTSTSATRAHATAGRTAP